MLKSGLQAYHMSIATLTEKNISSFNLSIEKIFYAI
jgi:hypothetical protein